MKHQNRHWSRALLCSYMNITLQLILLLNLKQTAVSASAAGQETLIGIIGKDYILLGADSSLASSISITSSKVDKITLISDPFPNDYDNDNDNDDDDDDDDDDDNDDAGGKISRRREERQQIIAVASAGESADCERLIGQLTNHASQIEFESGLGCDIKCLFHGEDTCTTATAVVRVNDNRFMAEGLDAESVAYLARGRIAKSLRSRDRMSACLLIGGMVPARRSYGTEIDASFTDRIQAQVKTATTAFVPKSTGTRTSSTAEPPLKNRENDKVREIMYEPRLFWLDEYGSLQSLEYGAHGLGANFVLSILDRSYQKDLSREDAVKLMQDCFEQLRMRFVINSPEPPCIKCIDCHGCKEYKTTMTGVARDDA